MSEGDGDLACRQKSGAIEVLTALISSQNTASSAVPLRTKCWLKEMRTRVSVTEAATAGHGQCCKISTIVCHLTDCCSVAVMAGGGGGRRRGREKRKKKNRKKEIIKKKKNK